MTAWLVGTVAGLLGVAFGIWKHAAAVRAVAAADKGMAELAGRLNKSRLEAVDVNDECRKWKRLAEKRAAVIRDYEQAIIKGIDKAGERERLREALARRGDDDA